jgi:hypothetical protein
MARDGLVAWGADEQEIDQYLSIIEQRCLLGTNGAEWMVRRMADATEDDRFDALRGMLADYRAGMAENRPVHTW